MSWYNSSWNYRVKITIDHTRVGSTLTDFPVYVDLSNLPSGFHTNVKSDGGDIRVTRSDGTTECAREVVFYDATNDKGELHFKANSISSSTDTDFYIYYGNSSASDYATTATYGRNNVWSNYSSVHHLQESSGDFIDATGGGNDGATTGTVTRSTDGKIGNEISVATGATNTVDVPSVALSGDVLVSLWARLDSSTQNGNGALIFEQSGGRYRLYTTGSTSFQWRIYETTSTIASIGNTSLTVDNWYHLAFRTSSGNGVFAYVNGQQVGTSGTVDSLMSVSSGFHLGGTGNSTQNTNSSIDETRTANSDLGASWISTEYNNQSSPSTFYTTGSQESGATSANSERGLYIQGKNTSSSERGLYTKGTGTSTSSERNLYIRGKNTNSSERSIYSSGSQTLSTSYFNVEFGLAQTGSSERGLYTKGISTNSSKIGRAHV